MIVYVSMAKPTDGETLAANVRAQLPEFSVTLRSTTPPEQKTAVGLWRLLLEGPDQPGIVSAVSECLARHGGNVHEMDTETTTAPFAGYTLFRISGKVALEDATLDKVYVALNQVEERFGASIMLNQIADK